MFKLPVFYLRSRECVAIRNICCKLPLCKATTRTTTVEAYIHCITVVCTLFAFHYSIEGIKTMTCGQVK